MCLNPKSMSQHAHNETLNCNQDGPYAMRVGLTLETCTAYKLKHHVVILLYICLLVCSFVCSLVCLCIRLSCGLPRGLVRTVLSSSLLLDHLIRQTACLDSQCPKPNACGCSLNQTEQALHAVNFGRAVMSRTADITVSVCNRVHTLKYKL